MRDILFRGKTEKGEWVYGDLLHPDNCGNGYSIEDFTKYKNNCFDVIPETVGQYTGLTDKNGKRIFEGDIIITNKFGTPDRKYVVAYDTEIATYIGESKKGCVRYFTTFSGDADVFEVIGNIHDNPELIGG
jgi:uncharacterized phage protein (TIGR01671 family)